jgi:hypothetical protein
MWQDKEMDINQIIEMEKAKQLEQENLAEHFANNFSTLEPNNYDDDEAVFRKETIERSSGYHIIYI